MMKTGLHGDLPLDQRLNLTGKVARVGEHARKSGGFSDVWEGWHDGERVAVKVIREFKTSYDKLSRVRVLPLCSPGDHLTPHLQRLLRETQAWSKLHHRNVLPFYGYTYRFGPGRLPSLVSPWMPNGTATEYLKERSMTERLRVASYNALS